MQRISTHQPVSKVTWAIWFGLGLFFALLTARVLLWEVHGLDDLTAEHWLTIGALVGAVASGVWFWRMLWAGKLLTAIGLALAFSAATVYCLIGSAGRGDEITFKANAAAKQVNSDRAQARRDLVEAKGRYESALVAETGECATGKGPKCDAKRETTRLRRVDLEQAERKVRDLPLEQRENGKLKRAAEILAFFRGMDQNVAEQGLSLIWPFIPPAVCELLTICFLHLAFGHQVSARKPKDRTEGTMAQETVPPTVPPLPRTRKPKETEQPNSVKPSATVLKFRRTRMAETKALQFVRDRLASGKDFPSQDAIASHCGVVKSSVSKWVHKWEDAGLIRRSRDGRCNVVSAGRALRA